MRDHSALPAALQRVAVFDPTLAASLGDDFSRLARAGEALAWAHARLPELLESSDDAARLGELVRVTKALTGAPEAWAVTWEGDLAAGRASLRALASDGQAIHSPLILSQSIVAQVVQTRRPSWSDDASQDARFQAAESVQSFSLRSVGCLPLGSSGVLYLQDPTTPGRFTLAHRLRLSALCQVVGRLLGRDMHGLATPSAESGPAESGPVPGLVGRTPSMQALFRAIRAFAPMPWPVLVLGETGTGKEAVSRALHALSPRSGERFIPVNCGAIVENLAESLLFGHERGAFTGADRRREGLLSQVGAGTLFLDEVGELPPSVQVKLLRLLQESRYTPVGSSEPRGFHGRIVAATHRSLDRAETRGAFREDLYYRLAAAVIPVPPLRDRIADVPRLARHLLRKATRQIADAPTLSIHPTATQWLRGQPWPGNVRELENTLRRGVARCLSRNETVIAISDLQEPTIAWTRPAGASASASASASVSASAASVAPSWFPDEGEVGVAVAPRDGVDPELDLQTATTRFQQARVGRALDEVGENRTQAAELLGVSRQWLHRLMKRWDEEDPAWRQR
ncbi:MAG: sigma-54 dependent transcriptional regulator [Myxococcota bacterium]